MNKSNQTTPHIMMVRPANFGFNEQTAESNAFQTNDQSISRSEISKKAITEFDGMVRQLRAVGVNVIVVKDTATPVKPDAIFPNNWVSFHDNGTVITYPMFTPNRQAEIREDVLQNLNNKFVIKKRIRFERFMKNNLFLEGTGSMILDRENRIVYACVSARTDATLLESFAEWADFDTELFLAIDPKGLEIYHTNVMMAVGETFVVICMDSIKEEKDKVSLIKRFEETDKEIIDISYDQMLSFAGNMLQVRNKEEKTYLVMSKQAYASLNSEQITRIEKHTEILACPIDTIENYGGGSARCMMAEVFLPTL